MPSESTARYPSHHPSPFAGRGFAIVPGVIPRPEIDAATAVLGAMLDPRRAGMRTPLRVPALRALATHPAMRALAAQLAGHAAMLTRAILFDKSPAANWSIPWHQDSTIAVRERRDVPGFRGWAMKEGGLHVHPPAGIMARVSTLRLHLDDCGADNGPLQVLPGSHGAAWLEPAEIDAWTDRVAPVTCTCAAGDVLAMSPLILHHSAPAASPDRRRVLHLEWAAGPLPGGLAWCDALAAASA